MEDGQVIPDATVAVGCQAHWNASGDPMRAALAAALPFLLAAQRDAKNALINERDARIKELEEALDRIAYGSHCDCAECAAIALAAREKPHG